MARRKNTKRIDPRYFLNETVNRGEETVAEEVDWRKIPPPDPSRRQAAQDRYDRRQRDDIARRRQKVKDDIAADKWKSRDRTRNQEWGEIEEETVAEEVDWRKIPPPDPSRRQAAQDRYDRRQRDDIARRRQKVKDDIAADKWKNRSRTRNQEWGEIEEAGHGLEEDVFSAIGDMVSRTGLAGGKAKKNVFWRKKGKSRYEKKIDDTPSATNWDFRSFFEDGDKYDASYEGLGRAWDDYLRTVVKSKQRSAKKSNDAYERKKQRERDAEERAKQQRRKDREEAEREAYRNSPEGRDKARRDAEIQADRDQKDRVRAAAAARKERERKSGGTGSWTDVFDFSHQLEEKKKK